MIVRSKDPKVLEFPFAELNEYITPNEQFYVRHHFPEPNLQCESWRLKVEGCVNTSLSLTYEELLALPSTTIVSTLECAGNNRIFLNPPVKGVQWQLGGISTASWTGVRLADILNLAGIKAEAVDIILEGADKGEVDLEPKPPGPIHFSRSLPLAKALDPDVLLCYRMNGEELTNEHGFPLRAIVPGWYAMASVKWLTKIIVSDKTYDGYFQTADYAFEQKQADGTVLRIPISTMLIKAAIAQPQPNQELPVDTNYSITGAAWCGESILAKVEISTDGGKTWSEARFSGESRANAWRFFEYNWHTPATAQTVVLMAKATDVDGNTQAMAHDEDRGTYMINHCLPISVQVR